MTTQQDVATVAGVSQRVEHRKEDTAGVGGLATTPKPRPCQAPDRLMEVLIILLEYGAWCLENKREKENKPALPELQAQPSQ